MLANVPQSDSGQSIYSVYDPQVEFLELGVKVGNAATEWKVFGNDLNGAYGGLHGIGGLLGLHSSDASAVERIVDDVYGHQQGVLNTGSGALSWTTQSYGAYGAFGAELPTLESGSTLASTRGWRGYRTDPTGFIYMGARYYNATEGRFISPDPFGHAASMDLYSFANGDPVNFVDPTGRKGEDGRGDGVISSQFTPISHQSAFAPTPTCMMCHGLSWQERAAIGLPDEQPWFNKEGTETAYKWTLGTMTVGATIPVVVTYGPAVFVAVDAALTSAIPTTATLGSGGAYIGGSGVFTFQQALTGSSYIVAEGATVLGAVTIQNADKIVAIGDFISGMYSGSLPTNGTQVGGAFFEQEVLPSLIEEFQDTDEED